MAAVLLLLAITSGCGSILLGAAGGAAAQGGGGGGNAVIAPPTLRIDSNLIRETGDSVTIDFTLTSAVPLATVSLQAEFQIVGQADFQTASPDDQFNPGIENLAASPEGTALFFVWDAGSDLAGVAQDVIFRLTPVLAAVAGTADQEGPFNAGNEPPVAAVLAIENAQSGNVVIEMTLSDSSADDVDVSIQFQTTSLDVDGAAAVSQPLPATIIGTVTGLNSVKGDPVAAGEAPIVLVWDSAADLPSERVDVNLFITPSDTEVGGQVLSNPFLLDNDTRPVVIPFRPFGDDAREIGLTFQVVDPDEDAIEVEVRFSTNGGLTFSAIAGSDFLATAPGEIPNALTSSAAGETHHVIWPSQNTGPAFLGPGSHDVIFELTPVDRLKGGVSGASVQTFPSFRVENGPLSEVNVQASGPRPVSVAIGDVDNNGLDDVVSLCDRVPGFGPTLQVHLQIGDGELADPLGLPAQLQPVQVVTGDFNGDGRTDVVTIHDNFKDPVSQLVYYRQNADGVLENPVSFGDPGGRVAVVVTDLDAKNGDDLVVINRLALLVGEEPIYELFLGQPGTAPPALFDTLEATGDNLPKGLAAFNRTGGTANEVVATLRDSVSGRAVLDILFIDDLSGKATVETVDPSLADQFVSNPTTLDANADGIDDLAVITRPGSGAANQVTLLLGDSLGGFRTSLGLAPNLAAGIVLEPVSPVVGPFFPHSLIVALDVDGNGSDDLAVLSCVESQVVVFPHGADAASPTFDGLVLFGSGLLAQALTAGDANGDRKNDVVTAATVGDAIGVVAQVGQGTFAARQESDAGAGPSTLATGDFNGDGRADIVVSNSEDVLGRSVGVFFQNQAGILNEQLELAALFIAASNGQEINSRAVAAGDLDGDGDDDIIITLENGLVAVFLADVELADGFEVITTNVVTSDFVRVVVGDFDPIRSGVEIALTDAAGDEGRVVIAQITDVDGSPQLVETLSIAVVGTEINLAVGDLFNQAANEINTADGIDDLLVTVSDSQGVVSAADIGVHGFRNTPLPDGTPLFVSLGIIIDTAKLVASGARSIAVGDLDGINGPDVALHSGALGDGSNSVLGVAFRQNDGSFVLNQAVRDLGGLCVADGLVIADLDGDGSLDLLVSSSEFDRLELHLGPFSEGPTALNDFAVIPSGQAPAGTITGDFNHDGRTDVAVAVFAESRVSVTPVR